MTEEELKRKLGQDIELPQLVRERMAEACRTAAESGRRERRPRRRTACGAAAATGPTRT